ncbi:MotA/TolQ/ExbB proton channel family protein [Candidatus Latescibacterota bacterium]
MNSTVELSVFRLIIDSTLFAKTIFSILLIISVFSWAIMINKYIFVSRYKSELSRFLKTLANQANRGFVEDCCAHFSTGYAKRLPILLLRLIKSKNQGKLTISPEPIINNAIMFEANKLKQGMGILASAANISPLIGLLGTVWGVMYSFMSIGEQGTASIAAVAPGIAEALTTTIAGLCAAIPAMTGHNLFSGWINECLDSHDRISEYALTILK